MAGSRTNVLEKDIFTFTTEDLKNYDVVVNAFGAVFGEEYLYVDAECSYRGTRQPTEHIRERFAVVVSES